MKSIATPEKNAATKVTRLKKKSAKVNGQVLPGKRAVSVARQKTPPIELYQKEECPFSHAVRVKLTELGLDYVAHVVPDHSDLKHQQLVEAGGKDQIPFLVDHSTGTKLYESSDIIAYLDRAYGKEQGGGRISGILRRVDSRVRARRHQIEWIAKGSVERVGRLRDQARDAYATVSGTVRFLRSTLEGVIARGSRSEASAKAPMERAASSQSS
jgi:glutathione S-transferase